MNAPNRFDRTLDACHWAQAQGTATLTAVAVYHHGRLVLDEQVGERPDDGRAALHLWLSATKPIAAILTLQAWEQGLLALDDPVARFVPEFANHGKQHVTLRNLLTHTSGIRLPNLPWPRAGWQGTVEAICASRLEPRWELGRTAGYHTASSWFILAEVLQRLHAEAFSDLVRRLLFLPLGCDECRIGTPTGDTSDWTDQVVPMWDSATTPWIPLPATEPSALHPANPAANGVGPIAQLARVWEMVRQGGALAGERILSPQASEVLLARHRVGQLDRTFRFPLDWGLGVIPNSAREPADAETLPYHYGPWASPRAVGHSGNRSSVAFCDPEHGLSVGLWWNALASDEHHRTRTNRVLAAIYEDLGIAATA